MANPETVPSKDVSARLKAEPASQVQKHRGFPSTAPAYVGNRGPQNQSPAFLSIPLAGLINLLRTVLPVSGRVHGMRVIGERCSINISVD